LVCGRTFGYALIADTVYQYKYHIYDIACIYLMQINQTFALLPDMSLKYIAMVAVIAATLVGATAITTDSAFATKYHKNQAVSQANACGNGELPLNIGCQNVNSQIQGDENEVALAGVQTFPTISNGEPEPPK
jgi:hypothetical protein